MPIQQEGALESCQRIETMLREVQQLVLIPGIETLAECESQLGMIAASLETLHQFMAKEAMTRDGTAPALPQDNAAIRQTLQQIQRSARKLKAQFDHGSNYCMGLLQLRLGTGYSAHGLPVLIPSQARSSFEG